MLIFFNVSMGLSSLCENIERNKKHLGNFNKLNRKQVNRSI